MRLKLILSFMTLFFVISIAFIPAMILSMSTRVEVIQPTPRVYHDRIHCNGTIIEKRAKELYLDTPVIAGDVAVEIGDVVTRGQVLASIDVEQTQTVLAQGATTTNLNDALPVNVADLAKQYGLSESDVAAVMTQYTGVPVRSREPETVFIPSTILSPIDGVVTEVNLQTDVLSQSARPALVVSDVTAYRALVSVSESDVARIAPGDTAVITGSGFETVAYKGIVSKIYPTARKQLSGTTQSTVVDVEIAIQQADARLKPGFSVKAVITAQDGSEALTVPYSAVGQGEDNREFVYVYRENRVEKRIIKTGKETADAVQVLDGIGPADQVVTNPDAIQHEDTLAYLGRQGGART